MPIRNRVRNSILSLSLLMGALSAAYGQEGKIPAAVMKKIGKIKIEAGDTYKTIKGVARANEPGRGINYEYEVTISPEGRLTGNVKAKYTDTLMGEGGGVAESNSFITLDETTLFCCSSDALLCVSWEERKKHPECKYWKIAEKK